MRPPREDYVRVTIEFGCATYEPAVEWREGDDFDDIARLLEGCALNASLEGAHHERQARSQMDQARSCATLIGKVWPDRAYFVEVWQDGKRGFAQCVQPYGFPRNWPTEHEDDCACWSAAACNCPYGDL